MERKEFLGNASLAGLTGGLMLSSCNTSPSGTTTEYSPDNSLIRQAAEREAVAIQTYNGAESADVLQDQPVIDTVLQFRDHHRQHLDEFNTFIEAYGGTTVSIDEFSADSRIDDVTNQEDALHLAMTLEWEAAASYFSQISSELQERSSRELFSNIFPVEVSHYIAYKQILGVSPSINSGLFQGLNDDHDHSMGS